MMRSVAFRFALRELRAGLHGFRIFLACLALGVAAIAAVGTVRSSIESGLASQGAALLGGDAEIELTYRFANDEERDWMNNNSDRLSEIVDFRSMIVTSGNAPQRGLTQVKAVDTDYPLVGNVALNNTLTLPQALNGSETHPGLVAEKLLVDRLALSEGDIVRLGSKEFVLTAVLQSYPDNGGGGFALGPRTIVRTQDLEGSGLIGAGTLFSTKYRLDLSDNTSLADLENRAKIDLPNSGLRWTDARNGAPGVADFVDRVGAFLILVGLSGLAVGGVGVSSAVRSYLNKKTSVIATLKTLGATRRTVFATYFFQVSILSIIGVGLGLVLGVLLPLAAAPLLARALPIPADFSIHLQPLFEAACYGFLASMLFTLWPLAKTENIKPAALFRGAAEQARFFPKWIFLVLTLALAGALVGLAAWFSGSVFLTLWTTGGIAASLVLLMLAASLTRFLAKHLKSTRLFQGRLVGRTALASIGGPREEAISVVLSLGLGLSVLAAVGQIDGTLRNAISSNLPDVAPSYFFVDIQNTQIDGFKDRLANDPSVSNVESAPMLRGIITQINGQPAKDVVGEHWVLDGDRGITYSAEQGPTTNVTEGEWWPPDYNGPALISFSAEEGAEMGLKIGDVLTLNILGRDISGEIANFRTVDFSTAGIGFILSMNPNALAGAPHTFISTVYADESSEAKILNDLATAYPNITAIRVRDAIDRAAALLASLASATSYGALATLLTGFLVLIGASAAGQDARIYEAAVLKSIGASRRKILISFALRGAIVGFAAGVVAIAAGLAGGWAVSTYIFDTDFTPIWSSAALIIGSGVFASIAATLAFAWRPIMAKPSTVLRNSE